MIDSKAVQETTGWDAAGQGKAPTPQSRPLKVLAVVGDWPSPGRHTNSFVKSQVRSLSSVGVETEIWNLGSTRQGWKKYALGALETRAHATQSHAELLHAHYGYCGWVARAQRSLPVVISFLGGDLLGVRDMTGRVFRSSLAMVACNRLLARLVDAVIVKSEEMARVLAPLPVHVVPNGVDLQVFQPRDRDEARRRLGWSPGRYYVLFPGPRRYPEKCWWLAEQVVRDAPPLSMPIQLVPLENLAPEEVPLHMNACDAVLMTSSAEGSPNVIKEALACNVPVVSVRVGDVPQVLAGIDGCHICSREPSDLGAALARVLHRGLRCAGRVALTQRGLDAETVARRIRDIYDEVLAKHQQLR